MKTKLIAACAAGAALALTSPAMASPETGTVAVSATLTAACSIGDGTLAFGSFNSITANADGTLSDAADKDNDTGAISYVCSNGATATLGIAGAHDDAGQLNMSDGTHSLPYNIYTDSGRTAQVTPGVTNVALTEDGTERTIVLYGRVPGATANKPIGAYTDTLTLTVTY